MRDPSVVLAVEHTSQRKVIHEDIRTFTLVRNHIFVTYICDICDICVGARYRYLALIHLSKCLQLLDRQPLSNVL